MSVIIHETRKKKQCICNPIKCVLMEGGGSRMSENTKKVYRAIRKLIGNEEKVVSLDIVRKEAHLSKNVTYMSICVLRELGYISYVTTGNKPGKFKVLKELEENE